MHPRLIWSEPDECDTEHAFDQLQQHLQLQEQVRSQVEQQRRAHSAERFDWVIWLVIAITVGIVVAAEWL